MRDARDMSFESSREQGSLIRFSGILFDKHEFREPMDNIYCFQFPSPLHSPAFICIHLHFSFLFSSYFISFQPDIHYHFVCLFFLLVLFCLSSNGHDTIMSVILGWSVLCGSDFKTEPDRLSRP